MPKKSAKSTRKFAASGQLKKQIQDRRKHQQIKRKAASRQTQKNTKRGDRKDGAEVEAEEETEEEAAEGKKRSKGMSVDDILSGAFMEGVDDSEASGEEGDSDETGEDDEDAESFADIDDISDEGEGHAMQLAQLAETDPEFYQYLQENDRELLEFDPLKATMGAEDEDEDDEGVDAEFSHAKDDESTDEQTTPVLTKEHLRRWQQAILEQHSLRALRKLLLAFRSAAHMNEDNQRLAWTIDNSEVYNKLIITSLRYAPVVLAHHAPYKTLPNGRFKPPPQSPKLATLSKLVLSYFHNATHLLDQLNDKETLKLAIQESAKIIPYIISSRKAVKQYLKVCLRLWSSEEDDVRLAAVLALRKLASSSDETILDSVLKGVYLAFVRTCKTSTPFTLPSLTLMKNSAKEIYGLDHGAAYQHAFGYIRQLAVHLRASMKSRTKEAYKQVYNWQYAHSVDFLAGVLSAGCDHQQQGKEESELRALVYPLIQVSLGAIKLISNSRSYPFHFQIIRSLLHLIKHTGTYVPLAPYIVPVLAFALAPSKQKGSTLKPLDLDTHVRAPAVYVGTRAYHSALVEEASYLLAEWCSSGQVLGSIAFPEISVPITVSLRRALKKTKAAKGRPSGRDVELVRALVEKIEESATWVEKRRSGVQFGPSNVEQVKRWEQDVNLGDSPLGRYLKVLSRAREKRKKLVEKAREGEEEYLEEE